MKDELENLWRSRLCKPQCVTLVKSSPRKMEAIKSSASSYNRREKNCILSRFIFDLTGEPPATDTSHKQTLGCRHGNFSTKTPAYIFNLL